MDPLAATVLSAFGLLLAFSLTLWMALTLRQRVTPEDEEAEADAQERAPRPQLSNDEVRGARADRPWPLRRRPATAADNAGGAPWAPGVEPRSAAPGGNGAAGTQTSPPAEPTRRSGEDPFERFLKDRSDRSRRDDFDF